jgi:hypothetical protein
MAECRGLAPHARRHALVSTEARFACPVGIPNLVGVGRLALPRLFGFESNRSALPGEPHAGLPSRSSTSKDWSATRDLHPEGSAILSRRGLLFPLKPVAVKWSAWEESHLQGSRFLRPAPLLFGANHTPVEISECHKFAIYILKSEMKWRIRQDSHLQTLRSKRRMIIISPRMRKLVLRQGLAP